MDLKEHELDLLIKQSMLYQAKQYIIKYKQKFWFGNNSFSQSQYLKLAAEKSVWLDLYPLSTVTNMSDNQSVLDVFSDPELLEILSNIGIKVIHTNPMQQAGSLSEDLNYHSTIDGGYDRINYSIDQNYGTNQDYKKFVDNAAEFDICVAGDVVPGHTGLGADFILALLNYAEYPSLFVMQEIDPIDWCLLPNCDISGQELFYRKNLTLEDVENLKAKNYIPGDIELAMFHEPGVKESNWSVTSEINGIDGISRRWLYLHWFKQGQPSLDWLNPSFAAQQLLAGDIIQHRFELGTKILRLDANSLLGLEKLAGQNELWGPGHPLSELSTKQLAMLMRRVGGYTYEENNAELANIQRAANMGPDLSYDFAMRTGYIHALVTGDVSLLRLQQQLVLDHGIDTRYLIHALQNHDNLCYELVHFDKYPDQIFDYNDKKLTGLEIKNLIFSEVMRFCESNKLSFKINYGGIQAHFAEVIGARLNIDHNVLTSNELSAHQVETIKQLMLLIISYNAMQPGIFQISGWDLVGAVHQNEEALYDYLKDGDTRWLCRSGFDLLGKYSEQKLTKQGIPVCTQIFGNLIYQLEDPLSLLNRLKQVLLVRERLNIANSRFIKVLSSIQSNSVNLCLYYLETNNCYYIVAHNFSDTEIDITDSIQEAVNYINYNFLTIFNHMDNSQSNLNHSSISINLYSSAVFELM